MTRERLDRSTARSVRIAQVARNGRTTARKSAVFSIMVQCPHPDRTCSRESGSRSTSWAEETRHGTTRSSRPCTSSTGALMARQFGSGQGQVVHPALPRLGEHGRPRIAHRRAEAGLVAQLDQLVGDQPAVVREQADDLAHLGHPGGVAPHGVQPGGQRHGHAHRAHQHDAPNRGRPRRGQGQGDRAAHRVADDVDRAGVQRVEQGQGVLRPGRPAVGARLTGGGAAEAELVRARSPGGPGSARGSPDASSRWR